MSDARKATNRREPVTLTKGTTTAEPATPRPPLVTLGAALMWASAVLGLLGSGSLFLGSVSKLGQGSGVQKWLYDSNMKTLVGAAVGVGAQTDATKAAAQRVSMSHQAYNAIATVHKGALMYSVVALLALGFVGYGMWRGRYWVRWGTVAVWFLASFTGMNVGLQSVLAIGSDNPLPYKIPTVLAALALIGAVITANIRANVAWFNLSRPAPRPGQPARRGLFAPPPPRNAGRDDNGTKNPARTRPADPDRARAKKRATTTAEATAKGAELARSRAKASKSRRTEV